MDLHGCPWITMDLHGYPWITMDLHGCPWITMDLHGCMDVRKKSQCILIFFSLLAGSETGPGTKTRSSAQAAKSEKKMEK